MIIEKIKNQSFFQQQYDWSLLFNKSLLFEKGDFGILIFRPIKVNGELLSYATFDGHNVVCKSDFHGIAAACKMIDGSTGILVDEYFKTLPYNLKEFILFHEIGHIELGHLNSSNGNKGFSPQEIMHQYYQRRLTGLYLQNEIDADAFASGKVGREETIENLKALKSVIDFYRIKIDSLQLSDEIQNAYKEQASNALIELDQRISAAKGQ